MPEAFALVKETARRFAADGDVEVTATDMDREIAANRDLVTIEGDKAYWQKSWTAAGSAVTWDMVHYDVQLIGGVALHRGKVAEMQTGEGKTLVATLPVFLNALAGRGVHVVTVNDYLARRDAEWMGFALRIPRPHRRLHRQAPAQQRGASSGVQVRRDVWHEQRIWL